MVISGALTARSEEGRNDVTGRGPATAVVTDAAVEDLYRQRRVPLFRLAVLLTDDRAVAEEIVQDAFAVLVRRWDAVNDPAAASGYLRTTVINAARKHGRRVTLTRKYLRVGEPDALPGSDYLLLLAEEHRGVLAALRRLPRRQREVLVLRYWAEMSETEIAATLGITAGTVKSSASRALQTLRVTLGELA